MKRDVCKFLSGMFVGFAIEHALIAILHLAGGREPAAFLRPGMGSAVRMVRGRHVPGPQYLVRLSGLANAQAQRRGEEVHTMKRDAYKFLAGSAAGLAYTHAAYAVAASNGIINEPVFLGRKWKGGSCGPRSPSTRR